MNRSDLPSLTALRGIAALVIVVYHLEVFFAPGSQIERVLPFLHRGYLAVDFFFLLSGFVIAHVYGEQLCAGIGVPGFLRARIARLYPLHLLTLFVLIGVVHTWPPIDSTISFAINLLPLNLLMLGGWHFGANWNYPGWSVGDEFLAYLAFVSMARLMLRGRAGIAVGLGCVGVLVALCALKAGSLNTISQAPGLARALAGFFLGVLLYRVWTTWPETIRRVARLGLLPLLVLAVALKFDALFVPAFAALIIVATEAGGRWRRWLNSGALPWLGDHSYSIYLWHAPVHFALAGIMAHLGMHVAALGPEGSGVAIALALAVTFAVATIGYRWFEHPARRLINARGRQPA
jgi:peptidoglycan/LPS O-acetylase OafA/YrhL